jgi:hypothetical protein
MAIEMDGSSDGSNGRANTSYNVDEERCFIVACKIDTMLVDTMFDGWV